MRADRLDAILRGEDVAWRALDTTPSELLDTCAENGIAELVHHHLAGFDRSGDWPDEVRGELARRAHAAAAMELVRGREVASVLDALTAAGVQPILFKGTPLAHGLYKFRGARPHTDTDLLIAREQIQPARLAMAARGYSEPPMTGGELVFCQFQMATEDGFGIGHVFDIHWKISTQSLFSDVLTYDELAAASVPVAALGQRARAAGDLHALLLACIHPVMHHRNALRLIWLYDIHLLASRLSPDELDRFASLAAKKQVATICAHQLAVARARLHTPIPESVISRLSENGLAEPSAGYLRPGRRWRHELVANVTSLPQWQDRLRLVREVLFPPTEYMRQTYRIAGVSGHFLLPAMYVRRILSGGWKVLRGRK